MTQLDLHATMRRRSLSTVAVLTVCALVLFSPSLFAPAASQQQDTGGDGLQDTMYDLEGSGEEREYIGSGDVEYESGSGSGEEATSGGEPCLAPASGTFPEPAAFESDLLPEIRCNLACIEHVMTQENISFEITNRHGLWPTIQDSVLQRNCSIYQKIEECKRGCQIRQLQPSLREGRCALQCTRDCNQTCIDGTSCYIKGSSCTRTCSESSCLEGCRLFVDEINQQSGALPPSPRFKPSLFPPSVTTEAGVYVLDAGNAAMNNSDHLHQQDQPLTSFIVRVIHGATDRIAFYWMHTLSDTLELGAFSCTNDVIVQYAAVNKYGRSNGWSPPTEIDVYGADGLPSPEHPEHDSIRFHISPDQRFGYWKHAVVSVYWNRPRGFHFVDHFQVTLHPNSFSCGRRQIILTVPRDSTRAEIQAPTPTQGPVDGCVYEISVASVPVSGMLVPPVRRILLDVGVTNPVPIDFKCVQAWSDVTGTFQFQLNWTIPNSTFLHNAIIKFHILLTFSSPGADRIQTQDVAEVLFEDEKSDYFYYTRRVPFGMTGSYYKVQMDTRSTLYDQILVPASRSCVYDGAPPPPDTPTDITINNNSVQFQSVNVESGMGLLNLELEWNPVAGNISSYEIRLFELEAGVKDDAQILEVFQPNDVKLLQNSASLTVEVPSTTSDGCIYAQVRSISAHGSISNWSNPECIFLAGLSLPTENTTPTATPTSAPTDTNSVVEVPVDILYITFSVAGIVLVAVVILTFFVCLACYQNRKSSKKARDMRLAMQKSKLQKTMSPATTPTKPSYQTPKLQFQGENPYAPFSLKKSAQDWELHPCQIIVEDKLGQGGYGDIFEGTIRGGVGIYKCNGPQIMRVAVKILRAASSEEEKRAFLDHIEQAKLVTNQLVSPNVVKMVGCVTLHEPHCLVTELPARGDLLTYLINCRERIFNPPTPEVSNPYYMESRFMYTTMDAAAEVLGEPVSGRSDVKYKVESKDLLSYATQIASGMQYLVSIGVIHGDLACRNIYLDENDTVKISDFGINMREKGKHRLYVKVGRTRLPLRWMAPEALMEGQLTVASDVWSFGVTVWEIATLGGVPYNYVSNKDILQYLMSGQRLQQPSNCSTEIYDMMKQCWRADKSERPTFTTLHEMLQDLSTSEDPSAHISLENVNPQCSYYQPKRKHGAMEDQITNEAAGQDGGVGTEDGFQPEGMNSLEDGADLTISYRPGGTVMTDSKRSHSFTRQALPQILEDEVGERKEEKSVQTREQEEIGTQTIAVQLKECDESTDHLTREESGLSASDCSDDLSSGSVSPHSIDREQTMDIAKSETTSLDSGCNMSQS